MDNTVWFSPKALSDLDAIHYYIAYNLQNAIAAEDTINGILDSVGKLKQFPKSGAALHLPAGEATIFRYVIFRNYLAFYHCTENAVFIDRVLYGRQDYIQKLRL